MRSFEDVVDAVSRAFGDLAKPGCPIYCDGPGSAVQMRVLQGKQWMDIRCSDLAGCAGDLVHDLTPKGLQYYFPAFLLCILDKESKRRSMVFDAILAFLDPSSGQRYIEQRLKLFSSLQLKAASSAIDAASMDIETEVQGVSEFLEELSLAKRGRASSCDRP